MVDDFDRPYPSLTIPRLVEETEEWDKTHPNERYFRSGMTYQEKCDQIADMLDGLQELGHIKPIDKLRRYWKPTST